MIFNPDRRDFRRLNVNTHALVLVKRTGERLQVELCDLSASGCGFLTTTPLAMQEPIEIRIDSPDPAIEPLQRHALISSITPVDDREFRVGAEFAETPGFTQ